MPRKDDSRREKGSGTITERTRADGTPVWLLRLTLPLNPVTGKRPRVSRTVEGTRQDAEKALRAWRVEVEQGRHSPPDRKTIAELSAEWLRDEAGPRLRPSTIEDYRQTIDKHLIPRIGTKRMQALTVADVHQFMTRMTHDGVGARTRQLALLRLKQMLDWALAMEWVQRNVAKPVRPPKADPGKAKAMSHAELKAFLDAAQYDYYWPLWLVYATTGVRRGEGLGLRWEDIHFGRKRLSVVQQVNLVKDKDGRVRPRIDELKSDAASRTLDLDEITVLALSEAHTIQQDIQCKAVYWQPSGLIFCTAHGTPHNPNNLYESFHRICEDAGLDPKAWNIHSLRHSHASHLILAGVPITEVSRRLGHANVSITLSTYAHLVNDHQGQAVAAIERALFNGAPELPG